MKTRMTANSQRAQRVDEIADRPLAHPRNAVDPVAAAGECECRYQRAHRQSGQAKKEVGLLHGERTSRAGYFVAVVAQVAPVDAERPQRVEHHLRVVRFEQSGQCGRVMGECGQQQRAIRNAFRAGKRNSALCAVGWSKRELRREIAHPLSSTTGCVRRNSHARRATLARWNSAARPSPSPAATNARARPSASP